MAETYRILIVDDDADVRETLKEILLEIGEIAVDSAEDGEVGLSRIEGRQFDLVFIDLRLPGMDGLELLRTIKGRHPFLPVVMITGFPSVDCAIQTMKEGAADFIIKPFRSQQIEHILERQLFRHSWPVGAKLANIAACEDSTPEPSDVRLSRKIKELSVLCSISEATGAVDCDVEDFYEEIVEMASMITGAERTSLMILDREANELRIKAARGISQKVAGSVRLAVGSGVAGRVVTTGKPVLVRNGGLASLRTGRTTYKTGSYISIPLSIRGEAFGVLNVTDKGDGKQFDEGEALLLLTLVKRAALNIENNLLYETLYHNLVDALQSLVTTLEAKDRYTHKHSERVTDLATRIAMQMSCTEEEVESFRFAGLLHDIGKIGIHDTVLQKSDKLTDDEYSLVKTHPIVGENIIKPLGLLRMETAVVRNHHERWDGTGYPDGLAGTEIPRLARILAVADAYDAMTSDRPYRAAKTPEEAIHELKRGTDSQFDRGVVESFLEMDLPILSQGAPDT